MLNATEIKRRVMSRANALQRDHRVRVNALEEAVADILSTAETDEKLRRYVLRVGVIESIIDVFEIG